MCIWYLRGSLLTVPWLLKVYVISLYILIDILLIFCKAFASKTSKICILYIRMFIHCTLADGKGGNCPISSLRLNRNENASACSSSTLQNIPDLVPQVGKGILYHHAGLAFPSSIAVLCLPLFLFGWKTLKFLL